MLKLIVSNRFEVLEKALTTQLGASTAAPLEPWHVIVGHPAVARHLSHTLAREHGVCGSLQVDLLAPWLWRTLSRSLPDVADDSPFDAATLAWRVLATLENHSFARAHARLAPYLAACDDAMRYELACTVARVFDHYTTERADWLRAWSRNETVQAPHTDQAWKLDEVWQRALWLDVSQTFQSSERDPIERWHALVKSHPKLARQALPSEVRLFVPSHITPLHWHWLQSVATLVDVTVFALNPSQAYWFEDVSQRQKLKLDARGAAGEHRVVGDPLLTRWGTSMQTMLGMVTAAVLNQPPPLAPTLKAQTQDPELSLYVEPSGHSMLDTLHRQWLHGTSLDDALAMGTAPPIDVAADDESVEIHACHSLRRQVEVAHERLLALFASDPTVKASDVLIVTPQIDAVAALVHAVFGSAWHASTPERAVAYQVSGVRRGADSTGTHDAERAWFKLLALLASRVELTALVDLLSEPLVMRAWGLADDDATLAATWLEASGFRWGIDGEHRAAKGTPSSGEHSLAEALERLMLAHLQGDTPLLGAREGAADTTPFKAATRDHHPSRVDVLAALARVCAQLKADLSLLNTARTANDWALTLHALIDTWLQATTTQEHEDLRAMRLTIDQWVTTIERAQCHERLLPWAIVHASLPAAFERSVPTALAMGGVTVAPMSAWGSIPHRVVLALGMDDGVWPSRSSSPEFDLRTQTRRPHDRLRRVEERQHMLELCLSARQVLWMFYTGRDQHNNEPLLPSLMVDELVEAMAQGMRVESETLRSRITTHHPLQPFDRSLFASDAPASRRSHHAAYAVALALKDAAKVSGDTVVARQADANAHRSLNGVLDGKRDDEADDSFDDDAANEDDGEDSPVIDTVEAGRHALPLWRTPLADSPNERRVSASTIAATLLHPSKQWLRNRLGVSVQRPRRNVDDEDPFVVDRPTQSGLIRRWLPALRQGASKAWLQATAERAIGVPTDAAGQHALERLVDEAHSLASKINEPMRHDASARRALASDRTVAMLVEGQPWQLDLLSPLSDPTREDAWSTYAEATSHGLVSLEPTTLKAKHHLSAWLRHLAWQCTAADHQSLHSQWSTSDESLHLQPLGATRDDAAAQATRHWQALVAVWLEAQRRPLPFEPEVSMKQASLMLQRVRSGIPVDAVLRRPVDASVRAIWKRSPFQPDTRDRIESVRQQAPTRWAWRGHGELVDDPDFARIAWAVFAPLLMHQDKNALPITPPLVKPSQRAS